LIYGTNSVMEGVSVLLQEKNKTCESKKKMK